MSEANRLGKEHASLPLELVGEKGRLIFTCSLKRWRRLRRTDRVLKHTWERRKKYSWAWRLTRAILGKGRDYLWLRFMLPSFIKRRDYLDSNMATTQITQLHSALRDLLQHSQAHQPESKLQTSWREWRGKAYLNLLLENLVVLLLLV